MLPPTHIAPHGDAADTSVFVGESATGEERDFVPTPSQQDAV